MRAERRARRFDLLCVIEIRALRPLLWSVVGARSWPVNNTLGDRAKQ